LHSKESSWQGDPFITDKTERNVCNSQQTIYHQILILKDVNFHMFLAENLREQTTCRKTSRLETSTCFLQKGENKLSTTKPLDWKSHISCKKKYSNQEISLAIHKPHGAKRNNLFTMVARASDLCIDSLSQAFTIYPKQGQHLTQ